MFEDAIINIISALELFRNIAIVILVNVVFFWIISSNFDYVLELLFKL